MGKIFFTGDLHFGHANVIAFDNRPFKTVEEMDAELIRRWKQQGWQGRPHLCPWGHDMESTKR